MIWFLCSQPSTFCPYSLAPEHDRLKQKQVWTCWCDFILNFQTSGDFRVTIWNRNKCGLVDMTSFWTFKHQAISEYCSTHCKINTSIHKPANAPKTTHFGWPMPPPHKPCYAQHRHTNPCKHTQLSPKSLYLYVYLFNSLTASFPATAQSQ